MARYVNRDDLEETFGKEYRRFVDLDSSQQYGFAEAIWVERTLPDADVVEQRHGEWVWDENGMDWGLGAWRCSECGSKPETWWEASQKYVPRRCSGSKYCPNCGAKMD